MPSFAPLSGARVFERMILKTLRWNPHAPSPSKQTFAIRRDQVRHLTSQPDVAVQPETAVHRVNHPIAPP